jgi:hypothetical protein
MFPEVGCTAPPEGITYGGAKKQGVAGGAGGAPEPVVRLFMTEVTSGEKTGYHFIMPIHRMKHLLTVKYHLLYCHALCPAASTVQVLLLTPTCHESWCP